MKVIISYELKLRHTSSPYVACQLKHQVLTLNNRPIMSCIFQRQCLHDTKHSLHKAIQEKHIKLKYRIHSFGKNYFKNLMYTHNTKFWCKKLGPNMSKIFLSGALIQIECCQKRKFSSPVKIETK